MTDETTTTDPDDTERTDTGAFGDAARERIEQGRAAQEAALKEAETGGPEPTDDEDPPHEPDVSDEDAPTAAPDPVVTTPDDPPPGA